MRPWRSSQNEPMPGLHGEAGTSDPRMRPHRPAWAEPSTPQPAGQPQPQHTAGFFLGGGERAEGGRRGFCLLAFLGSLAGLMRTLLIFTTLHSWLGSAVGLAAVGSSSGAELGDFGGASGSAPTTRLPPVSSGSGTSPLTPWGSLLLVCPAGSPVCPSCSGVRPGRSPRPPLVPVRGAASILPAAFTAFGSGAQRPLKPPKSQGAAHSPRAARDAGGAPSGGGHRKRGGLKAMATHQPLAPLLHPGVFLSEIWCPALGCAPGSQPRSCLQGVSPRGGFLQEFLPSSWAEQRRPRTCVKGRGALSACTELLCPRIPPWAPALE